MADLLDRLQAAMTAARKAQDKDRTLVLGTVVAQVKSQALDARLPLTEPDVLDVLRKGIKQRHEAAEQFTAGGRPELAAREVAQARVLEEFLPPAVDPEEVRTKVRELIAGGTTAMGPLMGALMQAYRGRIDGKVLNGLVREELPPG